MKDIIIRTVPSEQIRNGGVGDYKETEHAIFIYSSPQENEDYEALIKIHELVEFLLTRKRGISEESIDTYDRFWELANKQGMTVAAEPGDEPTNKVYRLEHNIAVDIERILCRELGYNFDDYNKSLK